MAVDDVGDPNGRPVVFLHGTPDARHARHPDDGLAAAAGVRLLAIDRPGLGDSDPDPTATPASVADDVIGVLDALGVEQAGVLAWSAGAIFGVAVAGAHPNRVTDLVLAAPLVPADAYGDPSIVADADDARRLFADHVGSATPGELGEELAPWLVPHPIDEALAREVLAESLAAVADIPGAGAALVTALLAALRQGLDPMVREVAAQATLLGPLLDGVTARVHVLAGSHDTVTPPAMGRWLADRLGGSIEVVEGAGHHVALRRWDGLLRLAAPPT